MFGKRAQYVASRRHGSSPSATVLVEVSRTALQSAAGLRLVFSGREVVVVQAALEVVVLEVGLAEAQPGR